MFTSTRREKDSLKLGSSFGTINVLPIVNPNRDPEIY